MAQSVINSSLNLLWENPNPTGSFGAQTVSLDARGFEHFLVHYFCFATTNVDMRGIMSVNAIKGMTGALTVGSRNTNQDLMRRFTINDTGATFEACYQNSAANSQHCVPYRIYGIR